MKDIKRTLEILLFFLISSFKYLYQGFQKKCFLTYLKSYFKELFLHVEMLAKYLQEYKNIEDLQSNQIERLKIRSIGLHGLMPTKDQFFYSLLVLIDKSTEKNLHKTLTSIIQQSAPHIEIILGLKGKPSAEIRYIIQTFKDSYPTKIKEFAFEVTAAEGLIYNTLVRESQGTHFFILFPGDFIRPDLLYRYEQTLSFYQNHHQLVLFCDEYQVDDNFAPIHHTRTQKPEKIVFPYVFNDVLARTLLVPKSLWNAADGFNSISNGTDLPLRLATVSAIFEKIPLHLYAVLQKNKTNTKEVTHLFKEYSDRQQLNWNWEKGYSPNTFRAIPTLNKIPSVHVIMLYKDQHNMTLSAVAHIQKQVGVNVKITAVDNNSTNRSIATKLEEKGVEVLRIEEPFNYSRLNNIAVQQSKIGTDCELLLFLNNDVDLDRNALLEMCRWIEQPSIGMVGCRLNYPNGLLQHGGVIIETSRAAFIKSWHHQERTRKFEDLEQASLLSIVPAVTAACSLMKKNLFLEIGGFDELWYPVAFSDTALAVKIRAKGYHCFYTPYASGIHHESISRNKINIEDYESLTWTHKKFVQHLLKDKNISFEDLVNSEY